MCWVSQIQKRKHVSIYVYILWRTSLFLRMNKSNFCHVTSEINDEHGVSECHTLYRLVPVNCKTFSGPSHSITRLWFWGSFPAGCFLILSLRISVYVIVIGLKQQSTLYNWNSAQHCWKEAPELCSPSGVCGLILNQDVKPCKWVGGCVGGCPGWHLVTVSIKEFSPLTISLWCSESCLRSALRPVFYLMRSRCKIKL